MEGYFQVSWCRDGNIKEVEKWLEDTENDVNLGDDHQFTPLHWAAKFGQNRIVTLLIQRGAKVNVLNRGDDTPLHLAVQNNHLSTAELLLENKAEVNAINEHGNTPLHYACFWNYTDIAKLLVDKYNAKVSIANRDRHTALEKCWHLNHLQDALMELASKNGQEICKIPYEDTNTLGTKTYRCRDATLTRQKVRLQEIDFITQIMDGGNFQLWKGRWMKNDVLVKKVDVRGWTQRMLTDFEEEYPKLKIFSHPNVLAIFGGCQSGPSFTLVSEYMAQGSLYSLLHHNTGVVVDSIKAITFARDIVKGMSYLHGLNDLPQFYLNSYHVMIDEENVARLSMLDAKFSFQDKGKIYHPAWMSPEALRKTPSSIKIQAADMWSFGVILWELSTLMVPFSGLSPMEAGMKIAVEGLRLDIVPGTSARLARLISMCMKEDPDKRPTFESIQPIMEKMIQQAVV